MYAWSLHCSYGFSELLCSLITIWILQGHALCFMNSIVIELYSLSLWIWNYYLICIAFHLSGSTWRIFCVASRLCSQPYWHRSNPSTVGKNCWCHSRKKPHPLFWCRIPGTPYRLKSSCIFLFLEVIILTPVFHI